MFDLVEKIELSGIRVIALDAVGTLIYPVQPVAATYVEVAAQFGVELRQEEIAQQFKHAIHRHAVDSNFESLTHATSEEIERAWWRGFIAEVLQIDSAKAKPIFDALWDYYALPQSWRLYDDARALIEHFQAQKQTWIIASNFDARLQAICRADPHLSQAQRVFPSSEVLWRKPSVRFYRRIEEEMALTAKSFLMVGDDPITDLAAARFASWQAVKINRDGTRGAETLTSLTDLPPIIHGTIA